MLVRGDVARRAKVAQVPKPDGVVVRTGNQYVFVEHHTGDAVSVPFHLCHQQACPDAVNLDID